MPLDNENVYQKRKSSNGSDVENNISAAGGDALTAINTAPGVVVQNSTINILGKGASRVMIDGRMIELSGEELNSFLKSISVNDIKSIEVIANPPAKYEANGTGGIINIIMKKGMRDSWKNAATMSYDQNKYGIYTLRNSFFYNKNKFRFAFSGNGRVGNTNNTEDLDIQNSEVQLFKNSLTELNSAIEKLADRITTEHDAAIGFAKDAASAAAQYRSALYHGREPRSGRAMHHQKRARPSDI